MEPLVLYHNPRCSKSRAALVLLEQRGVALRVVPYLDEPPTRAELAALAAKLGLPPQRWVRAGEDAYATAACAPTASPPPCSTRWPRTRS